MPRSAISPLQVLDLESAKEPPEGSLEIVRDLIDQAVASDETYRRIISWIKQNDCRRHPRRSFSHDPKKHFINPKGVVFRTPAGRPHGTLDPDFHGDHGVQCFPRSRLRLGSSFDPAFHYDCCASGRGALPASWIGCHGQIIAIAGTRRHANVYPNDYVR